MNIHSRIQLVMAATAAMTMVFPGCTGRPQNASGRAPAAAVFKVRIAPDVPDPGSPLSLTIDPQDNALRYDVLWFVNGGAAGRTANTDFFSYRFSVGDEVRATVTAYAGGEAVGKASSPEVAISNFKPVLDSIELDPFPVTTAANTLTARMWLRSGAATTVYRCRWAIDGQTVADTDATVTVPNLKAGQSVSVEVTPVTGASVGRTMHFRTAVLNGPPVFNGITFVSQDSSGYRYAVSATDRDGDQITYQLIGRAEGVRLDPATGALFLAPGVRQTTLTIRASDSHGSWVDQPFTVGQ